MSPRLPEPRTTTSRSETSFLARFCRLPGRLADRVADHRALLVPAGDPLDLAARERALDQVVEPVAVALLEGRALGLPVVGEDDDLVRPRRVLARHRDVTELVVELAERLERVGPLETRVVSDLVVAREGRVHGGPAAHDVGQDTRDDQVAHEDAERATHQRVDASAVAARVDVPANRPQRGRPLQDDFPAEQDERARGVVSVGEEAAVAGVRLLLRLHPAHGEDHVLGLAGKKVAAAGAAVDEQADACPAPPFDLRAVGRRRARHHRGGLLLHPAKGRDVLVRAQEDAGLAGARLRREISLPLDETDACRAPSGPCWAHCRRASPGAARAARARRSRGRRSRGRRCSR